MARELFLPELAESVVEGEIIRWLVNVGESVAEDQPVVEVMTDKVTVELPSPFAGVMQKHLAAEGDVVKVNTAIALIAEGGTAATKTPKTTAAGAQSNGVGGAEGAPASESGASDDPGERLSLFKPGDAPGPGETELITIRRPAGSGGPSAAGTQPRSGPVAATSASLRAATSSTALAVAPTADEEGARGPYGRVLAVPAARKLARELEVDIEQVSGSGPNGRIRVEDVRAHAEGGASAPGAAQRPAAAYLTPAGYAELEERVPFRGLRRMISNQMVASHLQTVRALHVDEADVSGLVTLRERLKPAAEKSGVKLSYLPFVMKAVVAALKQFPSLNSSLDEQKSEIVLKRYYNLGMAVATDGGLLVPVVKDVDRRSILDIASDVQRLAAAARAGKLTADEVKGGSFSVTNIGSLGGLFSFPIINVPEAAILGVHSIKKRPVVLADDSIAVRSMIYLSLSFDHRLVDGAEAALFTGRLIELLETPELMLLDL